MRRRISVIRVDLLAEQCVLKWFGHIERMEAQLVKKIMGVRLEGRP